VVGEPGAEHAVSMTPVEGGFWRGIVPLAGRDPTNLCFYVCGESRYDAVSDTFLPDPVYWGDASQTVPLTLPVTGVCGSGGVPPEHRIRVSTAGSGCVHVLFDDLTGAYRVTRAEYQNFNGWAAPPDVFTDSNGQVGKQKITQSFDGWTTNVTQRVTEYFAGYPAETNVFAASPSVTFNGWVRGSSAYAVDRLPAEADNTPDPADPKFRNVAVMLMGGKAGLGLGYIHNREGYTLPDGIDRISFKCRLGQVASPREAVYYTQGFLMQNYLVRASVGADAGMSSQEPSLSVLGYYLDYDNFYEYRMTQVPDTANLNRDKRILHELYKWRGGVPYRLTSSTRNEDLTILTRTTVELRMFTSGSTTTLRCKFGSTDNVLQATDSGSTGGAALTRGTCGFMSAECRSGFSGVFSQATAAGAVATGASTPLLLSNTVASDIQNWSYAPAGRWEVRTDYTVKGIYTVIPTQKLGVFLQPTEFGTDESPHAPGTLAWTLFEEVTLSGFGYQNYDVPVSSWRSHFVMLQPIGRTDGQNIDVAVDELQLTNWRGRTGSDLSPGEDEQMNLPAATEWVATEAWVSDGRVDLDHRRGGREVDALGAEGAWLDQSVRSPCMMTGAGMLEFDYQVLRAPARLTVQYAPAETPDAWQEVSSWVVTEAMTVFSHASVFLGTNNAGYLRVLNERDDACVDARVLIDHAVAWDEPPVDDTAWRAYNAKISDSDALRVMLDESKACFLNNSQTAETDPVQDRDLPFLQSPALAFPFGSLTFMARAYDAGMPATIAVYASTNGCAAPAEHWFKAHEFSGISHVLYQTYRFAPSLPAQFDAIRLVVATDGSSGRACVDDVAVCEPDAVAVAPCLIVQGPASPISERAALDGDGQVTVRLSEPYPEAVEVRLDVSPGASAANGCLSLTATNLVFEAGSVEQHVAINAVKDGTALSGAGGFTVTPVMVSPAAAQLYYSASFPAVVRVLNNAPLIVTPIDSGLQEPAMTIPCGQPFNFYWDVHDVSADSSADVGNGMMITWNFGDGSPSVVWGASGMISHVFASAGDWVVRMTACDKDGDADDVYFMVRVLEPATLLTPVPIPYAWLNLYPSALAAAGGDYESAAQDDTDSDGQATWQEYVAGSDPTNFYSVFRAGIVVSNGIGWITWAPDLGPFARRYTVEGKTNLTDEVWSERKSGMRFFKVKVSLPD
nr:PKD domain-containing protein [Kiritimatiellia bacterium]